MGIEKFGIEKQLCEVNKEIVIFKKKKKKKRKKNERFKMSFAVLQMKTFLKKKLCHRLS